MSCADKATEFVYAVISAGPTLAELVAEVATKKVKAKTLVKAAMVLPSVLEAGWALIECLRSSGKTAEADAVQQKVEALQQEFELVEQYAAA